MFDAAPLDTGPREASPRFYLTEEHHPENGTLLGFWLYLMSDCLVFACLFAMYAVLGRSYAGGPTGAELFDLPLVAVNTALLLLSSITYGFAMLEMQNSRLGGTLAWLVDYGVVRRGIHRHRAPRVRAPHSRGRGPAAQRLSVVVLHARRYARAARDLWSGLARHVAGATGSSMGSPPRTGAGCSAFRCSGTFSTWCGSGCLRSCT